MFFFAPPHATPLDPLRPSKPVLGGVERAAFLVCIGAVLATGLGWWSTGRFDGVWWTAFLASVVLAFVLFPTALLSWRHAQGRAVFFSPSVRGRLQAATDVALHAVLSDLARDPTSKPPTSCEMSWTADTTGLHLVEIFAVEGPLCLRSWGDKVRMPPLLTLPWPHGDVPRHLARVHAPALDVTVDMPKASGYQRLPLAGKAVAAAQALGVPLLDLTGRRSA